VLVDRFDRLDEREVSCARIDVGVLRPLVVVDDGVSVERRPVGEGDAFPQRHGPILRVVALPRQRERRDELALVAQLHQRLVHRNSDQPVAGRDELHGVQRGRLAGNADRDLAGWLTVSCLLALVRGGRRGPITAGADFVVVIV
jgi:hypothetical protein